MRRTRDNRSEPVKKGIRKVILLAALVAFVGVFGVGTLDVISMEYRPGGKKTCEVVGIAEGKIALGEYRAISLECPELKRSRGIEVTVPDPKKFTVGGRAECTLLGVFGGISGIDRTARDGVLKDCMPL